MTALFVFIAVFALDFVWARYTLAMTGKRRWAAGSYGALIIVLAGVAQIGYTSDPWLLVPAALGAFAGTAAAVEWE